MFCQQLSFKCILVAQPYSVNCGIRLNASANCVHFRMLNLYIIPHCTNSHINLLPVLITINYILIFIISAAHYYLLWAFASLSLADGLHGVTFIVVVMNSVK